MKHKCFVLMFCLMASPVVNAQQVGTADFGDITIFGVGNKSCGSWEESHKDKDSVISILMLAWVTGFLTGYQAGSDKGFVGDIESAVVYIDNFCSKNPLEKIALAGTALAMDLASRVKKQSKKK